MAAKLRKLNIEVTTRCNLNCETCVRKVWHQEAGDMSLLTFRRLATIFPTIECVGLLGIGEPLLNEHLVEMIRLAKGHLPRGGNVVLTTNATLIDRQLAKQLVATGIDSIVISIDGATSDTFNQIRQNADFSEVLVNTKLLSQAKKQLGSETPEIGFEFVAMKKNIDELPAVVKLAAEYAVDFVIVSQLLPHSAEMNEQIIYEFNSDEALEIFSEAEAEARNQDLDLILYPDFIPEIQSFFGMPPLRGPLPSTIFLDPSVSEEMRGHTDEKDRIIEILKKAREKAVAHKVVLNLTKLLDDNRIELEHYREVFDEAKATATRYNIDLDLPPLVPIAQRECGFIRDGICFINWDGYVRPCNNLYHSYKCYVNDRLKSITEVSFGNVLEQDFWSIWNSPGYVRFREEVDRYDFPPCGDCSYADGCSAVNTAVFSKDCYFYTEPCGDCPWARGILKCI